MNRSALTKTDDPRLLLRMWRLCLWTVRAFVNDNVPRLGAALAFYTTIAVAPLLVLTIAFAGIFFEESQARQRVLREIEALSGRQAAQALEMVEPPGARRANVVATTFSLLVLAFGALRVFRHLQDALNEIWRVRPPDDESWRDVVKRHLFSFGLVVVTGFILLVSLVISAAVTWMTEQHALADWPDTLIHSVNVVISFTLITFLFATVFRVLPQTAVRWHNVWLGAGVTALLFNVGKHFLALYLANTSVTSGYGFAASIITLLLWTYYAAQIVLLGAEFTRIENASDGGRHEPR